MASRATSPAGGSPPVRSASMASTTIGSRMTSFIPLSSRSANRAGWGRAEWRIRVRSSTGSVEASAAPRIAAAGAERSSRTQAARAMSTAGRMVPGPRITAASRRCSRTSPVSTAIASVKSTRSRPSVAMTWSDSESSGMSTRPRPAGPSRAPNRRKMATWGSPERSTAPESSDETRMTRPIRARVATKVSWDIQRQTPTTLRPLAREAAASARSWVASTRSPSRVSRHNSAVAK